MEAQWHTVDAWPRTEEAATRLHPYYTHLAEGRLTTTRCKGCGKLHWHPRVLCPACYSEDLEWVDLPRTGRLHGFTVQEAGLPPGYKGPIIFGIVEIEGLYIFAPIVDCPPEQAALDMPVAFTTIAAPPAPGGIERVMHAFKPA